MKCPQLTFPVCLVQFHPLWSVFPFVYSLILSAVVSSYVLGSSFSSHFLSSVESSHVMKVSVTRTSCVLLSFGDHGLSQLSYQLSRFSCLFLCRMGKIVPMSWVPTYCDQLSIPMLYETDCSHVLGSYIL